MKKGLAILLMAMMVFSLVACGEGKTDAQLEAEGWVKNPAENGWIKRKSRIPYPGRRISWILKSS